MQLHQVLLITRSQATSLCSCSTSLCVWQYYQQIFVCFIRRSDHIGGPHTCLGIPGRLRDSVLHMYRCFMCNAIRKAVYCVMLAWSIQHRNLTDGRYYAGCCRMMGFPKNRFHCEWSVTSRGLRPLTRFMTKGVLLFRFILFWFIHKLQGKVSQASRGRGGMVSWEGVHNILFAGSVGSGYWNSCDM